ncbi:MAG: argininosuccinate lyase [Methanobacteriota archaeon]
MLRRGRFERQMEPIANEYTSSMKDDVRIFYPTIQINIAHTIMLAERGIIQKDDAVALLRALRNLYKGGISKLDIKPELEDVHMAVEEFVTKETGEEIGGKLHTAKSRNDQVSAAIRLALRKRLLDLGDYLLKLINTLVALAEKNLDTVMPGYTHLQVAEPTTFGHYLSAYCSAFLRDLERIEQAYNVTNSCPMGACAFAGTSFPIDRVRVGHLLGFKRIDENTMDAVSSRDFIIQSMSALAIAMVNISRLAEELSLWSSAEFSMIEMPDEFVSTSSIMPQKKNPVVTEMARAKAGRIIGNLAGALALLKALPQAYNLDLQELTPMLWSSVDETINSVEVMEKLMGAIKPKKEAMRDRAERGFSVATELADNLVRNTKVSFREAHSVVGRMTALAVEKNKSAKELTVEDLKAAAREILGKEITLSPEELEAALDVDKCVASRELPGGPALKSVKEQIMLFKRESKLHSKLMRAWRHTVVKTEEKLLREVKR